MEDDDPLGQFRRPGIKPAEKPASKLKDKTVAAAAGGLKPYVAFDAKDKLVCLEIRRVLGATHCPTYAYLLNLTYDYEFYTGFVLYYSFMQVQVRGKNLRDVISAIKLRKCEFIQDFHAGEHVLPAEGEPVINSITVQARDATLNDSDEK